MFTSVAATGRRLNLRGACAALAFVGVWLHLAGCTVVTDGSDDAPKKERKDKGTDAGMTQADGGLVSEPLALLPGDEGDDASEAVPHMEYEPDLDTFDDEGFSKDTLLISFELGATVGDVNQLLEDEKALIVAGYPGVNDEAAGVMAWRLPTNDADELRDAIERIRKDSSVAYVSNDNLLMEQSIPASDSAVTDWDWFSDTKDGNWGMKLVGVPGMWNWNESIRLQGADKISVGIVDGGFYQHDDLDLMWSGSRRDHGTHVAGIIGALFDNGKGVQGANPFVSFQLASGVTEAYWLFSVLPRWVQRVSVINYSMGMNWRKQIVQPGFDRKKENMRQKGALAYGMLKTLELQHGRLPQIVTSAGNDAYQSRFNSSLTSAALKWGARNIIVVENLKKDSTVGGRLSDSSNINGTLSAPGDSILSTVRGNGYGVMSGTSMASPLVAGVISYLYALEPELPLPTLDENVVLDVVLNNVLPAGGGAADRLDAFRTALDVDTATGQPRALRALVDVDDGTVDGNQRVDAVSGERDENLDHDGSGGRGDGVIDMSDFRVWRDARAYSAGVTLDGGSDHPKLDLDGDGTVSPGSDEKTYSRMDFNGDGELSPTATADLNGAVNAEATDLDVLSMLFDDELYTRTELPALVDSADITISLGRCLGQDAVEAATVTLSDSSGKTFKTVHRSASDEETTLVLTVPQGEWTVNVTSQDGDGRQTSSEDETQSLEEVGQDVAVDPKCEVMELIPIYDSLAPSEGRTGDAVRLYIEDVGDSELTDSAMVTFTSNDGQVMLDADVVLARTVPSALSVTGFRAELDIIVPGVEAYHQWTVSARFVDPNGQTIVVDGDAPVFNALRRVVGRWNMNLQNDAWPNCTDPNPGYDWYFWADGTWTDIGNDASLDADTWGTGSAIVTDGTWTLNGNELVATGCPNDRGTTYEFHGTYDPETQTLTGEYTVLQDGRDPYVQLFCTQGYSQPIAGCLDTQCHPDRIPFTRQSCIGDTCVSGEPLSCLAANGVVECADTAAGTLDMQQGCTIDERCSESNTTCCTCIDDPDLTADGVWQCADPSNNTAGCPALPVEEGTACSDSGPAQCHYCSPDGVATIQRCSGGEWLNR